VRREKSARGRGEAAKTNHDSLSLYSLFWGFGSVRELGEKKGVGWWRI